MLCPVCLGDMRPLFTGWFCPRDCDRPRSASSVTVGPWDMFRQVDVLGVPGIGTLEARVVPGGTKRAALEPWAEWLWCLWGDGAEEALRDAVVPFLSKNGGFSAGHTLAAQFALFGRDTSRRVLAFRRLPP